MKYTLDAGGDPLSASTIEHFAKEISRKVYQPLLTIQASPDDWQFIAFALPWFMVANVNDGLDRGEVFLCNYDGKAMARIFNFAVEED